MGMVMEERLWGVSYLCQSFTIYCNICHSVGAGGSGKTVYVGNLSWDTQSEDLKDYFGQVGSVANATVQTMGGGRSKVVFNLYYYIVPYNHIS
jgi:hypothetical protein